jgi:hypothetical protein
MKQEYARPLYLARILWHKRSEDPVITQALDKVQEKRDIVEKHLEWLIDDSSIFNREYVGKLVQSIDSLEALLKGRVKLQTVMGLASNDFKWNETDAAFSESIALGTSWDQRKHDFGVTIHNPLVISVAAIVSLTANVKVAPVESLKASYAEWSKLRTAGKSTAVVMKAYDQLHSKLFEVLKFTFKPLPRREVVHKPSTGKWYDHVEGLGQGKAIR